MPRPNPKAIRALNEREYLTEDNLALVEVARDRATEYVAVEIAAAKDIEDAQPKLVNALAHIYALLRVFEFPEEGERCADHETAGVLLNRLGVAADDGGMIHRPVLALVKHLFPGLAAPQWTRYTQVLAFIRLKDTEATDNATPTMWQDYFKEEFAKHGSVRAVLRAKTKAEAADKPTEQDAEVVAEREAMLTRLRVDEFYGKAKRYGVLSTTLPVDGDTLVVMRRISCGSFEAIPIPVAADQLNRLIEAALDGQ